MPFPVERMRRLRRTPGLRRLTQETRLSLDSLIEPHFVCPGTNIRREVSSMPGCAQLSVDLLVEECTRSFDMGIRSIILFGIPAHKDAVGSEGYTAHGIVPQGIAAVKMALPDMVVWADVCLCEYTDHGHCGVIDENEVDNDATLPLLAKQALAYARAGADGVAPSDMMDGRVAAIRAALDDAGFGQTPIMAYAAKFASAFYGNLTSELEPFRCAMPTMPCQGRTFERPNRIWFVHEGGPNPQYPDLPGSYLPFDGSLLDRAKKSAIGFRMSEKEFVEHMKLEMIEKAREESNRRRAALEADLDARERDFEAYADKQFERISEVEAAEFQRSAGDRDRPTRPTIVVP